MAYSRVFFEVVGVVMFGAGVIALVAGALNVMNEHPAGWPLVTGAIALVSGSGIFLFAAATLERLDLLLHGRAAPEAREQDASAMT